MATIVYLDVEDEITTAAARIRTAGEPRVGMVIPFGSRVATSRINFRLLAREALDAGRRLDVVAPDASARALAASAGLPVFASVAEYEAALAAGEEPAVGPVTPAAPAGSRPGGVDSRAAAVAGTGVEAARAAGPRAGQPSAPTAATSAGGPISAPGRSAAALAPAIRDAPLAAQRARRGPRRPLVAVVLVLAVVVGFGGAAVALALPAATITLTPVMEAVTPIALTVRANPAASGVDPVNLVIPATLVDVPLTAQAEFSATGTDVTQTSATGAVTFDSINTVNAMPIPRGTRVSTLDGVTFATTAAVTVPRATVSGTTIAHGIASVGVTAVSPGPKGNVDAKAIDQVPSSLAALQVSVSNAAPTTGGTRTETPKIVAADVSAARDQLAKDLADQMAAAVADPTLAPQGATLFPDTAKLGSATYTPDAAGLDGKVLKAGQTTFTLQADATATVTAVDESPLKGLGDAAIRAAVKPGYQIVDGSVDVIVSDGSVGEDGTVSYTVTATALQRQPLDAAELKAIVVGKSRADAEAALARYGKVTVSLSPFWVTAVPDSPDKVTLTIATPEQPAATPTPPPTARPTPRPSHAAATAGPASPGPAQSAPAASPVPSG